MRYTTTDADGNVHIGNKMYKVTPMQGVYQPIADWDEFVSINAVMFRS